MNELSLFSGAGGGVLGSMILGHNVIGYVEFNDYCQRVLAARIQDGYIPEAPIFGDIKAFISEGYAATYTGLVDVLSAGFPCQPFSQAGKREGANDKRNMWPSTIECIRIIRPRIAFLENVPGLLTSGYFSEITGALAESGYDCRWRILSAAEVGAPHLRKRLWIVANAESTGQQARSSNGLGNEQRQKRAAHSHSEIYVAHTDSGRQQERNSNQRRFPELDQIGWWQTEPNVGRVAHGLAHRVDRLKALGNGQVPLCAAVAFRLLAEDYAEFNGEDTK